MARDRLPGKVTSEPGPKRGEEASDGLLGTNCSRRREEQAERPGVGPRSTRCSLNTCGGTRAQGLASYCRDAPKSRGVGNLGRCT